MTTSANELLSQIALIQKLADLGPILIHFQQHLYLNDNGTYEWHSAHPELRNHPILATAAEIKALHQLQDDGYITRTKLRSGAVRITLTAENMALSSL